MTSTPKKSSARKALIVRKASPVSEFESDVRQGMDNIADAVRTLAGVFASLAAGQHTTGGSNQRDMASVIYADAQERFGDVVKKLDPKLRKHLETYIDGLCKGRR